MSAWMPCFSKNWRVSSGYSLDTRTPCGQVGDLGVRRVVRHREHDAERLARGLRVLELAEDRDVAGGLLHPVAPGDAEVEEPLGHVGGDLLGAQDAHLVDARVVDARLVLDGRRARRRAGRPPRRARGWASPANPWAARGGARGSRVGGGPPTPETLLTGGSLRRHEAERREAGGDGQRRRRPAARRWPPRSRSRTRSRPRGSRWPGRPRRSALAEPAVQSGTLMLTTASVSAVPSSYSARCSSM